MAQGSGDLVQVGILMDLVYNWVCPTRDFVSPMRDLGRFLAFLATHLQRLVVPCAPCVPPAH